MREYQKAYLQLLSRTGGDTAPADMPTGCAGSFLKTDSSFAAAVEHGTALLRDNLFPVLDNILSADEQELEDLFDFAQALMAGGVRQDIWLHYRIHLALMDYARHQGRRDMLLRELYLVGMSLYNMENMLSPNVVRLYNTRMRMYFSECGSYFGTEYYDEFDAQTRGYIHRSLGNIALSYTGNDVRSAKAKLDAITRSVRILSDPEVQAKTPELPWDTFLYKSHQERTSLLSFLRSGNAGPEAFAQVLESAQIVQERQLAVFRDRGVPPEPRWQYAYMAARYHCGAMLLPELLDGLYALSTASPEDDFGTQGVFCHVTVPALYMEYSKNQSVDEVRDRSDNRLQRMIKRMRAYLYALPAEENSDFTFFNLRQFLYAYREGRGLPTFYEILQDAFASRSPAGYVRMCMAGRVTEALTAWAVEDFPEKLIGLCGCESAGDVRDRKRELCDFAMMAGRLYDVGMFHFIRLEISACRGLFEEEAALLRLHAHCGAQLLKQHGSTRPFADIALGHHRPYDEKGGYPLDFSPRDNQVKPMIYLVALADAIIRADPDIATRSRPAKRFADVLDHIRSGDGTRYAPFAVALLRDGTRCETLRTGLERWKKEALLELSGRRDG